MLLTLSTVYFIIYYVILYTSIIIYFPSQHIINVIYFQVMPIDVSNVSKIFLIN